MKKLDLNNLNEKEIQLVGKIWSESSLKTYAGAEIIGIYISDSGENIFINGKTNKHGNTMLILYLSPETNTFELGKMFAGGVFTPIDGSNMLGVLNTNGQVNAIFTFKKTLGVLLPTEKSDDLEDSLYYSNLELYNSSLDFVLEFNKDHCGLLNPQKDSVLGYIYVAGASLGEYERDFVNTAYGQKAEEESKRKNAPKEMFEKVLRHAFLERE